MRSHDHLLLLSTNPVFASYVGEWFVIRQLADLASTLKQYQNVRLQPGYQIPEYGY